MQKEAINHPSHYNVGKYEVIEVIYGWGADSDFDLGNALKYIARAGHKESVGKDIEDKTIEDLKKALWYLTDFWKRSDTKKIKRHKTSLNVKDVVEDWQLVYPLDIIVVAIYNICKRGRRAGRRAKMNFNLYMGSLIGRLDNYITDEEWRKEELKAFRNESKV